MKIYTVCSINYEYNDEYNYSHDDAGHPIKGFRSHDKAVEECKKLNEERMVDERPSSYSGEDYPWLESQLPRLRRVLNCTEEDLTDLGEVEDGWDDFSDTLKIQLWDMSQLSDETFYTITEIEVEDCKVRATATR